MDWSVNSAKLTSVSSSTSQSAPHLWLGVLGEVLEFTLVSFWPNSPPNHEATYNIDKVDGFRQETVKKAESNSTT